MASKDDDRLKEIRENWDEDRAAWDDIRKDGDDDIACLTGGIWGVEDPEGAKQRTEAKRPMIDTDELNQYCNQGINDLRANKRGIKVTPMGNGATDQTARWRQGKIRDIEYRSNAHQAYTTMGENAFQRGFGWMRLVKKYVSDESFEQELLIEPVLDPNSVTPDAYSVRSDGKDLRRVWVRETRTVAEFRREFPNARIRDFSSELQKAAPSWLHGATVDIAECWEKRSIGTRTRIAVRHLDGQSPPQEMWKSEAPATLKAEDILKQREVEQFQVVQYLTNGVELLKTVKWDGKSIPFVPCYGKVMYVQEGGATKRVLLSLVRLARSPQMLMNYLGSAEAELVGSVTKFPYFVIKGSLSPKALDDLAKSTQEPVSVIELEPIVEGLPAGQPPPWPQRNPWDIAAVGQLELLREAARRAIQAAIGQTGLPTQAQRRNEKSGVALKQIEDSASRGSFHFVDHYDEGITRMGELINENLASTYDTARTTSIRQPNDEQAMVRVNDPTARYAPNLEPSQDPQHPHIDTQAGDHDVTISVGPRKESEREESNDFLTNLMSSEIIKLAGPQKALVIAAAGIRAMNFGPMVEAIADILDPKDPQGQQAASAQLQQAHGQLQQMGQELQALQMERHAKTLDLASKEKISAADNASKEKIAEMEAQRRAETAIAVAEISSKSKDVQLFLEERARIGLQTDNAEQAALDRQHEVIQSELEHQQGLEAGQQAHDQALEQGQAGVQGQIAVAAAALQPANGEGASA